MKCNKDAKEDALSAPEELVKAVKSPKKSFFTNIQVNYSQMVFSVKSLFLFCLVSRCKVLSKGWKEGIEVIGANTSEIINAKGYNQVLLNARPNGSNPKGKPKLKVHSFMYLRLSETIFSTNYDMFKKFVRNMHADQVSIGKAMKLFLGMNLHRRYMM